MQWIVNDLSIDGEFCSVDDFFKAFMPLMQLRAEVKTINDRLLCSRMIGSQAVTSNQSFSQAVMQNEDRNTKALILGWIDKRGPFWDDDKTENGDDYFQFEGEEVTDTGLGEISRRLILNMDTSAVSLLSPESRFDKTPLLTVHGIPEEPLGEIEITNFTTIEELKASAESTRERPNNWPDAVSYFRERFNRLVISNEVESQLQPQPFSTCVLQRIEELLGVLQAFIDSRDDKNLYTPKTHEILKNHFHGDKAWFSDESKTNKEKFKEQLKFNDPTDDTKIISCPFHGKIKNPQFRIHFEWEVYPQDEVIKIVYIGPKITRS